MLSTVVSCMLTLLVSAQAAVQAAGDRETPPSATPARSESEDRPQNIGQDIARPRLVRPGRSTAREPRPAGRPTLGLVRSRQADSADRADADSPQPRREPGPRVPAADRKTIVVRLEHAPAADTAETIHAWLESEQTVTDQAAATVVPSVVTNDLIITAAPEQLETILSVVQDLDRASPQIHVKAMLVDLALAGAPESTAGVQPADVSKADFGDVLAELKKRGELRVLARPEMLVADNQPAQLQFGSRVPRITGTMARGGARMNQVEMQDVGTVLGVTGRVNVDDRVTLEIDLERSHLGPEEEGTPISTSDDGTVVRTPEVVTLTLQTTVSVQSGQIVALGGMVYQTPHGWAEMLLLLQPEIIR